MAGPEDKTANKLQGIPWYRLVFWRQQIIKSKHSSNSIISNVGQIHEGNNKGIWQRLGEGTSLFREIRGSLFGQSKSWGTRPMPVPGKEDTVSAKTRAGGNWCAPGTLTPWAWDWSCSSLLEDHTGAGPGSGLWSTQPAHQPQALGKNLQPCWACLPPAQEPSEGTCSFLKPVFTELCAKQFNWAEFFS